MPSSWSPSTTRPRSSTATHRSASPSSAKPTSAPSAATIAASAAGAVAPQPRLMFTPSGSAKRTLTRAPVAARISPATPQPEPFAQSTSTAQVRPGAACQAQPVLAVALERHGCRRWPAPSRALVGPTSSSERQMSASSSSSTSSSSFEPRAVEHLEPVVLGRVVGGRDHDARAVAQGPGGVRERGRGADAHAMDVDAHARGTRRRARRPACPPTDGCPGRPGWRPCRRAAGGRSRGPGRRRWAA